MFGNHWCRIILTSAAGVTQAVQPLHPMQEREVWTKCERQLRKDYLRLMVGVLNRTLSHMWGNWNLLIFLLRDVSLTLMYMASFTVLVVLCTSVPTCPHWCVEQWCRYGHRWEKVPKGVPWAPLLRSLQIPICTPHCNSVCHTHTYRLLLKLPLNPLVLLYKIPYGSDLNLFSIQLRL